MDRVPITGSFTKSLLSSCVNLFSVYFLLLSHRRVLQNRQFFPGLFTEETVYSTVLPV